MGDDVSSTTFSKTDFDEFRRRLQQETSLFHQWVCNHTFHQGPIQIGLELEGCLIDQNGVPSPTNEEFLKQLNNPLVVPELSKFNFEVNSTPCELTEDVFCKIEKELSSIWSSCQRSAQALNANVLAIGILPTLRDDMLGIEYLSNLNRYYALNQQIFKLRSGKPMRLSIQGRESVEIHHSDVMLEAAATSLQVHIKTNVEEAARFYNASQILSAPMVAVAANAPFLFGKSLWEETRIPVFEQAVRVESFRDVSGKTIGRVTFGTGYASKSLFEPFLENLSYPIVLPIVSNDDPGWLTHLRLHNGTIWRWNRPIIGISDEGVPHLRVEHRVMSAGPTISDIVANIALFVGLCSYFGRYDFCPEKDLPFDTARKNFYRAAREGLAAKIDWLDGKSYNIQELLVEQLLPLAKSSLLELGVASKDVKKYLDDIMNPRIRTGRTGSHWQQAFINTHGAAFQEMTEAYRILQKSNLPVHEWTV